MQDRYVGDTGDYAKYSLLSALSEGQPTLPLGILWYRFPDEGHNGDGRHIAYLDQPAIALRNPRIHGLLSTLVRTEPRSVAAVQKSGVLPPSAIYYSDLVSSDGTPASRLAGRSTWFAKGLKTIASTEVVFFDPDNGIETPALKHSDRKAGKYVFWEEIEAVWATGRSLVIYNHLNRSASAAAQTERLLNELATRLNGAALILPLLFRRGSCRHLWVIAQPRHRSIILERVRDFLQCGWSADTDSPELV